MNVEGKWWVLYEDEPLDTERSRLYGLRAGKVFDGRTGEPVGTYEALTFATVITLNDQPGDSTIYKLPIGTASEDTDVCRVDWSTTGFELYRTNWPVPEGETEEEEWARDDWENEHFGMSVTYGSAMRDRPQVHELYQPNEAERAQGEQ